MKILLNIQQADASNQGILRQELSQVGASAVVSYKTLELAEIIMVAKKHHCSFIVLSHPHTLRNCVPSKESRLPVMDDWRGSVLTTSIPILVISPISHVFAKTLGRWILHNDIQKLQYYKLRPEPFVYKFKVCHTLADINDAFFELNNEPCHVIDIETTLTNKISSVSITAVSNDLKVQGTFVIPLLPRDIHDDAYTTLITAWTKLRELLASNSSKVFHNGCFDCFQLLRYHCPVVNWIFDTEYLWHCWEAEAKKSLAFISSILLPDYYYWKHESAIAPLEYNAKDTINTARVFITLLQKMPKWAWANYAMTIPNAIPIVKTQFEGLKVDIEKKEELRNEAIKSRDELQSRLAQTLGINGFNAGSPQQVSALFYRVLRAKKPGRAKSDSATGELDLKKVAQQHPLYSILVPLILNIREERKAISTYYDARLTPSNHLLYSLQLDGTETERMACNSSSIWAPFESLDKINKSNAKNYGTQAQNLPYYYKKAIMAEEGYSFLEIDKSQSEARCTAYLSGDKDLIQALEDPPEVAGVKDFYCYTGYKFFNIEFDKKHELRQAVKKIIHGTNYMMGAMTFIDSAGVHKLQGYKKLVGYQGQLKSFATHLLDLYHYTYPKVKGWWDEIVNEIAHTGYLVTPDGWTRKFHGNIRSNHSIKRSAVAHCSQHFSVRGVNRAFWQVFYEIEVPTKGAYRLKAQIHDSLVGIVTDTPDEKDRIIKGIVDIMSEPQSTPNGDLVIPLDVEVGKYWKK